MATTLVIDSDNIELYKILKLEGLASSGAEAKQFIADGLVTVNGDIETRKRKKIISGDIITFDDNRIIITQS
jgi:ribosome-associated protein